MKLEYLTVITAVATVVCAVGELGFNMGTKEYSTGRCKSADDYLRDLRIMKPYASTIRLYSTTDCNLMPKIQPALQNTGMKAVFGIWPGNEFQYNAEIGALALYLPLMAREEIEGIAVGSEVLLRGDIPPYDFAGKIYQVKALMAQLEDRNGKSLADVPVGTSDSWNVLIEARAEPVIQACDMVMANAYSYWQAQPPEEMSFSLFDDIQRVLARIQAVKNTTDVKFWIGETGWPTGGQNIGAAWPNVDIAERHWKEAICAIRAYGVNVMTFEYEDEPWKQDAGGTKDTEKHWGIFDSSFKPKYNITCDFGVPLAASNAPLLVNSTTDNVIVL